jgi:ABC-type Na+ efflux pump permease subunit
MSISAARIGAVIRKELAEFRRNRFIVVTATILPIVFLVSPTTTILALKASAVSTVLSKRVDTSLFLPLLIPVFVPALLSSYAVVGEREQGTLEPVLTTPVSAVEFLLGKAAAIFMPAVGVAYLMFGIFVAITQFGAAPAVATAVLHAPQLPAALVFIPLLAGWAIWVGLAISARATDTRVAQQLGTLASLPPVGVAALFSFRVISPTFAVAAAFAGGLLIIDALACFAVARVFDRERLITGTKPTSGTGQPRYRARGAS